MLKGKGIRGKFVSIISIVTILLLTTMALTIISFTRKSQSQQTNAFLEILKVFRNSKQIINN